MTADQVKAVLDRYRQVFEGDPWASEEWSDYPSAELLDSPEEGSRHCALMLDRIEVFLQEDQVEKAMRWLGFIQGFLWTSGRFTLDELKDHNRPKEVTEAVSEN